MSLVQLDNVCKIYHTDGLPFPALNGISFSVEAGEFLALAGPSGSGKTTALNIIGCLDKPTSGSFYLDDVNMGTRKNNELADIRRFQIGFIFQTFNLIPVLSAYENVEFPLLLKGNMSASERRESVTQILKSVGLGEFMNRKPSQLSGGQQQRVSIARALIKKPKLILADEPTANLDSKTGKEVLELMLELNGQTGTAFIFSTHDRMVMDYARRVIFLKDGSIDREETTKNISHHNDKEMNGASGRDE